MKCLRRRTVTWNMVPCVVHESFIHETRELSSQAVVGFGTRQNKARRKMNVYPIVCCYLAVNGLQK